MFICINTHFICYISNAGLSTPHYPVFPQLEEKKKCFSIGTISLRLSNIGTIIYFLKIPLLTLDTSPRIELNQG